MNYRNMIDKLNNPSGSFGQFIRKLGEDHARKNDYLAPAASMSIHTGDTSTAVEPVSSTLIMEGSGGVPTQAFTMNGHCFDQMAKHIGSRPGQLAGCVISTGRNSTSLQTESCVTTIQPALSGRLIASIRSSSGPPVAFSLTVTKFLITSI